MIKKKYFEILPGIIGALLIWCLPFLLTGRIIDGSQVDLNYSHLGFGKLFLVLFLLYNVTIASFAKKKGKKKLFMSSLVTVTAPIIFYLISFLSYFIDIGSILGTLVYVLSIPVGTAIFIYAESVIMTIVSGFVIFFSPILSLIIFKCIKGSTDMKTT